jgi:hypothetical protein
VDDSRCLRFFLEPTDTLHRRYEALRAYFVEQCPLQEIARRSGYSYNTLRDLICDFRARSRDDQIPPFSSPLGWGDRHATACSRPSVRRSRRWRTAGGWTSVRDAA